MSVSRFKRFGTFVTILSLLAPTFAQAADVDLAQEPLVSGLTKVVRPNVYFILDDSGSMGSWYMPDNVTQTSLCGLNYGHNSIYYNPNITYLAPKTSAGANYADQSWTAAAKDGLKATSSKETIDITYTVQASNPTITKRIRSDLTNTSGNTANLSQFFTETTTTTTAPTTSTSSLSLSVGSIKATGGSTTFTVTQANLNIPQPTGGQTLTFQFAANFSLAGKTISRNTVFNVTWVSSTSFTMTYSSQFNSSNLTNTAAQTGTLTLTTPGTTTTTTSVIPEQYAVYTASPNAPPESCAADSAYTLATPQTTAEKTNFANWFAYYRTRLQMMKSTASLSFSSIGDKYRVGFSTISETGTGSTKFLSMATFGTTQKSNWYSKLFSQSPGNSTPLRGALSKAGRYYAGTLTPGATTDPVQYSCQQNFTILTTDGYWNTGDETATYTALQQNNSTLVGDQDVQAGHPYSDHSGTAPSGSNTYSNTLADIAMYYYKNDLRTGGVLGGYLDGTSTRLDVSTNNVPVTGTDTANWQHMVTFTIGLGVGGLVPYEANYYATGGTLTAAPSCPSGKTCPVYKNIRQGNANWPDPQVTSSSSTVVERVDDLWHAAVNGRGRYLSARDPSSLTNALNATLSAISAQTSSAASAATSNLEPVSGDNFAYVAQYTTALWTGDLLAKTIDLVTGTVSAANSWSASTELSEKVYGATSGDGRTIYNFDSSRSNKLNTFPGNLATSYFDATKLSQYGSLTSDQRANATSTNLINYIRGRSTYQNNAGNDNGPFRDRSTPLGDIVNSAPVFVRKPPFNYAENSYSTFKNAQNSRSGTIYVGANDGMLHAFNADTGEERWAYVPTAAVPNLYKLADFAYPTTHQYFVDGPLTVGDVFDGSAWHTVLVGGLGGGGQAYFALDVTDPTNPKAMWEFGATQGTSTDADLGYTYGNPIITKRDSDNRWVVIFASGYNNTGGDKKGRLYVLDAVTGAKLSEITTDSSTDPNTSGIARVANYVTDSLTDNRTQYVYGGDLGGRLWRFDINNVSSQKLGQANSTLGNEPISVRPELGNVRDSAGTNHRVVYFGTGRYLGFGDLSSSSTSNTVSQTVYGVKDTGTDLGDLRATSAALVKQTLDSSVTPRTIPTPLPVDWSTKNGWYVDVPVGERFSIDPRLQLGTLVLVSNAPKDDYCVVGGSSYFYALDYKSGTSVTGQLGKYAGWQVGNSLATGLTLVRLPTGKLSAVVNQSDTSIRSMAPPTSTGAVSGATRVGWREIE